MHTSASGRGSLAAATINIPPGMRVEVRALTYSTGNPNVLFGFWVLTTDQRLVQTEIAIGPLVAGVKSQGFGVLQEGVLVAAFCDGESGAAELQQTWIECFLLDASRAGEPTVAVLLQGWAGGFVRPVWPQDPLGAGIPQDPGAAVITVANPAAGANWLYTLAGESWLELVAVAFTLTTDANVANRVVRVECDDTVADLAVFDPVLTQTAGQVIRYLGCASGVAPTTVLGDRVFPIAGIALPNGNRIGTLTGAIQVGDQFSAIRVVVRRRAGIT